MRFAAIALLTFASSTTAAENNWYVGVEANRSDVYNLIVCIPENPCPRRNAGGHSNAWGAHVGFRFNKYVALEYGYRRIFDGALNDIYETTAQDLSVLVHTPPVMRVSAYARLGLSRLSERVDLIVLPDRDSTEQHYGLGLNWQINDRISARVERAEYDDSYVSKGHVFSAGLSYSF
jgi:hypothetical protein